MKRWLKDLFELAYLIVAVPVVLLIIAVCGPFKRKRREWAEIESDEIWGVALPPMDDDNYIAARVGHFDVHRDGTIHARKPVGPPRDARGRFAKKGKPTTGCWRINNHTPEIAIPEEQTFPDYESAMIQGEFWKILFPELQLTITHVGE